MSVTAQTFDKGRVARPAERTQVNAFARLRHLLEGVSPPACEEHAFLHLGEIGFASHIDLLRPLGHFEQWCKYPPPGGTPELRDAYSAWLQRRFGVVLPVLDGRLVMEPTAGTKQALSVSVALAVARARASGVEQPAVLLPNPFYPTYLAATNAAGAEPVYYSVRSGSISQAVAAALARAPRRVAAVILCHPGSPGGEIVNEVDQLAISERCTSAGATLMVDECYIDLFTGTPPASILALADGRRLDPSNLIVFHTLSKRSGTPGLRSGFAVGGAEVVSEYASYNRNCGVSSPLPVCVTAARLWEDEHHVLRLRKAVARNWDLADIHLGSVPGYRRAETGFFLWLPVADDEAVARRLWSRYGLMAMPGRYLGACGDDGGNPGANWLRVALIQEPNQMASSLSRIRAALNHNTS